MLEMEEVIPGRIGVRLSMRISESESGDGALDASNWKRY